MLRRPAHALTVMVILLPVWGCHALETGMGGPVRMPRPGCWAQDTNPSDTLARLCGPKGPSRFARVTPRLYRGGQPSAAHMVWLHDLGIDTIINLRAEDSETLRAEERQAARLDIRFVHFPFYGVFGADREFIMPILQEMRRPANGTVYVHCKAGRDRTSLLVALHQVFDQGKDLERAWQEDALDMGHKHSFFMQMIQDTFNKLTRPLRRTRPAEPAREIETYPVF